MLINEVAKERKIESIESDLIRLLRLVLLIELN